LASILNRLPLRNQEQLGKQMADTKIVVNCETGEVTEVELTADEIAQREADAKAFAAEQEAEAEEERAKATAKADLLEKLGITEDEAKLLLS
jgi:uncharacterized lipoprotein NlpE involved in copper resistance